MNTYNLDINKYNNNELENLLKLKKNYNIKDLGNAKNKILNNLSKKEGMDDKKASLELFLDNIYNKLSNKLKEIPNNNNNKLEQFDKHFIIQNQNKGYSILDNNQPIEKSIIKKTYNIDSQFRKNYLETSTNYTLDLPEKIQKVITMSISSINIPLTYYNISDYNKNNILSIYSIKRTTENSEKVGEQVADIELNNGMYTNENIIDEIQNQIYATDLSNVLQCGIDKTTGLVYFVLSPIIKYDNNSDDVYASSYAVLSDKNNENFKVVYTMDDIIDRPLLNAIYLDEDNELLEDYTEDITSEQEVGFYIKLNYSDYPFEKRNCTDANTNCSSKKEIYDDRRVIQQKQLTHMLGLQQTDNSLIEDDAIKKIDFKKITVTKPTDWVYKGTQVTRTYTGLKVDTSYKTDGPNAMPNLTEDELTDELYHIYTPTKYGLKNNENFGSIPCYISYAKYVYIAIDDFQANSKNYFTLATESLLSPNIIARINIGMLLEEKKKNNSNLINTGAAIDFLTNQKNIREYFGPTNVNRLKISLIDEYGELLNLNDRDWSFLLTFECLYN